VVRRVYEMYTQQGLSINEIARLLNEEQISDSNEDDSLGAIHGLGDAAQPGLPGPGLLWEDRTAAATTHHASICGDAGGWRAATVPTTNGLDPIGSRSRFRL